MATRSNQLPKAGPSKRYQVKKRAFPHRRQGWRILFGAAALFDAGFLIIAGRLFPKEQQKMCFAPLVEDFLVSSCTEKNGVFGPVQQGKDRSGSGILPQAWKRVRGTMRRTGPICPRGAGHGGAHECRVVLGPRAVHRNRVGCGISTDSGLYRSGRDEISVRTTLVHRL